eukprot:3314460-Pyramimonas_sp.AAC.1
MTTSRRGTSSLGRSRGAPLHARRACPFQSVDRSSINSARSGPSLSRAGLGPPGDRSDPRPYLSLPA